MMVFFQTKMGKKLTWQKCSGMWESNFELVLSWDQVQTAN